MAAADADLDAATTAITGLGLVEDAELIAAGIRDGSWVDGTLGGVGASLDTLALAMDPLGTLAAWGVAWLIEHVRPLQEGLNWLAGNADEVAAQATTWAQVAAAVDLARQDFADHLQLELGAWSGATANAYRAHADSQLTVLQGISTATGGIASAVEGAGLVVGLVRSLVRDLIAQFVGTLAVRLPQWLAMEGLSLGVATPLVASQVAGLVARCVNEIQHFLRALLNSLRRLLPDVDGLKEILNKLGVMSAESARKSPTSAGGRAGTAGTSAETPGSGGHDKPDPKADAHRAFTDNIVAQPRSVAGRSAQSIADEFNGAGYPAVVEQSTRKGTSGKAVQVRIEGHPEVTNIQVHPGGGRHTPEGSPYWKISTSTEGKIWVIPKDFRGADELVGKVVRYDD
ncbi:hypothetical protein AB0M02_22475 [Actinoplanes sp. NPDC051861]|uniref:WXG100 family type VII secretion target n=1 Tax=Actinoplanes sp. NPDC051861 TaxID=3155170 RepID=UPI003447F308